MPPSPPYEFARPARSVPYVNFLQALVHRYGPNGSIRRANPDIPKQAIRMWQIWKEPIIPSFWPDRPFEKSYVALLRAAHVSLKSTDPGAQTVLAACPTTRGTTSPRSRGRPGSRAPSRSSRCIRTQPNRLV